MNEPSSFALRDGVGCDRTAIVVCGCVTARVAYSKFSGHVRSLSILAVL